MQPGGAPVEVRGAPGIPVFHSVRLVQHQAAPLPQLQEGSVQLALMAVPLKQRVGGEQHVEGCITRPAVC